MSASDTVGRSEVWRTVEGFNDYEVSNRGRIRRRTDTRNKKAGELLRPKKTRDGYKSATLYKSSYDPRHLRVHRLVALAFLANPEEKPQVNHLNGQRSDNRVENLEWCTAQENSDHGKADISGEANPKAKLTPAEVIEIRNRRGSNPATVVAEDYSVSASSIRSIWNKRTWTHV